MDPAALDRFMKLQVNQRKKSCKQLKAINTVLLQTALKHV